jgi:hypothetical protein
LFLAGLRLSCRDLEPFGSIGSSRLEEFGAEGGT